MSEPRRVYLVLHEQRLALQLEAAFRADGWEAVTAESARALEALLDDARPDLVVLGVLLPDANGLEVSKRLKADRRTVGTRLVVISSLKRSAKFAMEARTKFGVDLYLEMPLDPGEIAAAIHLMLRKPGGEEERRAEPPPEPKPVAPPTKPSPAPTKPAAPPTKPLPSPPAETAKTRPAARGKKEPLTPRPGTAGRRAAFGRAGDIPDAGKLGPILLPELLLSLYQRHASGTLIVKTWEEQRNILMRDGRVIAIHTNFIRDDALGQILLARGIIERVALERSLARAQQEKTKLGRVLVREKLLTESELTNVLRSQARRKMNSAFRWKEGSYEFLSGHLDETDTLPIEQDMLSILLAGINVHYDLTKLEERVYQHKEVVVVRGETSNLGPGDLNITKGEWHLLNLIDGERTLGEVIAEADLNFARTFQLLYLFLLFGLIRFADGDRFFRIDEAVIDRAKREAGGRPPADEIDEAQPEEKTELADSGDLARISLVQFLYQLFLRKATGKLVVARGEQEETVFLAHGMPVRIASNRIGPHTLGNLLVGQGKISAPQRDRALAQARETGHPLGEMLLAEGLITPHDLFAALVAQVENKLIALFTWREGNYSFTEGAWDQRDIPPITVDLTRLILRGVRDTVRADRIEAELRKYRSFPLLRAHMDADLVSLFTDPRESALVAMIDGRRTLGDILERAALDQSRALQMIYSLLQLGLIAFKEE